MRKRIGLLLCAVMLMLGAAACAGLAERAYDLPLDIGFANYPPDPAGYTESTYHDDSLDIRLESGEYRTVKYHVAYIQVKSPTQLRTAIAGRPNENVAALPTQMGKANKAVLVLNGEYYVQRSRDIFIWRQGQEFRNQPDPVKDVLIIDEQGDFHLFTSEEKEREIADYRANGGTIVNAFSFGPALVIDGEKAALRKDYYFKPKERTGRSAVCQMDTLSYAFLYCPAATQQELCDIAASLNARQAYNLDGGNSSVLVFNGEMVGGKRKNTEREQSDILYVVSAVERN